MSRYSIGSVTLLAVSVALLPTAHQRVRSGAWEMRFIAHHIPFVRNFTCSCVKAVGLICPEELPD